MIPIRIESDVTPMAGRSVSNNYFEALAKNGWRGRERWLQLYRGVRYGELTDNCMMRSMAIL